MVAALRVMVAPRLSSYCQGVRSALRPSVSPLVAVNSSPNYTIHPYTIPPIASVRYWTCLAGMPLLARGPCTVTPQRSVESVFRRRPNTLPQPTPRPRRVTSRSRLSSFTSSHTAPAPPPPTTAAVADPWSGESAAFVGPYAALRAQLDYTYHVHYSHERQRLQDDIVASLVHDQGYNKPSPSTPRSESAAWVCFSAGPMGSGKSHTLRWLCQRGLFPLERFVYLDPDAIKARLPEMQAAFLAEDTANAASLAHKESGYICELAVRQAICEGRNILIDGSLRDRLWYRQELTRLHKEHPNYRIAILHVMASDSTVLKRVARRSAVTHRVVPEGLVRLAYQQVPLSVASLAGDVDFIAHIDNDGSEPQLLAPMDEEQFRNVWDAPAKARPQLLDRCSLR